MHESDGLSGLRKVVTLHDDAETLEAASTDFGRIARKTPRAVVTPRSPVDVLQVIRHARRAKCPVSTRGAACSQSGQSLSENGILLDMRGLDRIGEIERDAIRVQGGVRWQDLVRHVHARGYMPMVLTSDLDTTIGGTLSIAGLGASSHLYGSQADNVEALEVVTGEGRLVRCSRAEHVSLFDCTRCGLGQFSVITEARIRLRRVPPRVRTFALRYDDLETLMKDQERVISRGRFQYIESGCQPREQGLRRPGTAGSTSAEWSWRMDLTVELDSEPDEGELLADLNYRWRTHTTRSIIEFVEGASRAATPPAPWPPGATWKLAHPWTEGILPWRTAAACVPAALDDFPADLLNRSRILLGPLREDVFQAPMFMHPEGRLMMGFGIQPEVPPPALPRVLPVMRKVSRRLTGMGGKRYLSSWVDHGHEGWKAHFGERWPRVLEWKETFDPDGILNPGFIRYRPE